MNEWRRLVWVGDGQIEEERWELALDGPATRWREPGGEWQELAATEVLVKVKAAGRCGTDVGIFQGELSYARPPRVLLHEYSGQVVAVGRDVNSVSAGQRVALNPNDLPCGECPACRRGLRVSLCERLSSLGVHRDGGAQTYCVATEMACVPMPDAITYEQGAFAELLSCIVNGFDRLDRHQVSFAPSDWVLMLGCGPVGLCALQLAVQKGARRLIAVDLQRERLELMARLIANAAEDLDLPFLEREPASAAESPGGGVEFIPVNVSELPEVPFGTIDSSQVPGHADAVAERARLTAVIDSIVPGGVDLFMNGIDRIHEGVEQQLWVVPRSGDRPLRMIRRGGTLLHYGHCPEDQYAQLRWSPDVLMSELLVVPAWLNSSETMEAALDLMAEEKVRVEPLVTHRVPLTREALADCLADPQGIKAMVLPEL